MYPDLQLGSFYPLTVVTGFPSVFKAEPFLEEVTDSPDCRRWDDHTNEISPRHLPQTVVNSPLLKRLVSRIGRCADDAELGVRAHGRMQYRESVT